MVPSWIRTRIFGIGIEFLSKFSSSARNIFATTCFGERAVFQFYFGIILRDIRKALTLDLYGYFSYISENQSEIELALFFLIGISNTTNYYKLLNNKDPFKRTQHVDPTSSKTDRCILASFGHYK